MIDSTKLQYYNDDSNGFSRRRLNCKYEDVCCSGWSILLGMAKLEVNEDL
jgi:hypothetical protein